MNHHGRLTIFIGGEVLRARHRNRGVARNNLFHQATHGLQTKGQRNHIKQKQLAAIALVAGQGISLDRSTNGNHLIRVDIGQGLATKHLSDRFTHTRYTGRTTHHDDGLDVFNLDIGVAHSTATSLEAARNHWLDHGVEGFTGQLGLPATKGNRHRGRIGQRFFCSAGSLQQGALRAWIKVGRQSGLLDHPAGNRMVKVIATQRAVATGARTSKTPPVRRRIEISNVPPPRS